jgi:hypothetical protein
VEASYHGSALLYRLLQNYPKERLRVVETTLQRSLPERRLASVTYDALPVGRQRWLNTRFHALVATCYTLRARGLARQMTSLLKGFAPEAVLSVAHGFSWLTAAEYARQHQLPLHLIVHDDCPTVMRLVDLARGWFNRKFGSIYREAASRMCVSPYMVEVYRERYGAGGTVLYPSRAANAPIYSEPPARLQDRDRPLVYAFAGTMNTGGHVRAVRDLADCLAGHGGCLHIYGPITQARAQAVGLARPNVRVCGLIKAGELVDRIRQEVDVLFVPISFATEDEANMSLCFPSKLTDYTATGLPLLICGPAYSSAVRWARENRGVAEVVEEETQEALSRAVERLAASPTRRFDLGKRALEVGNQYFAFRSAQMILEQALQSAAAACPQGESLQRRC